MARSPLSQLFPPSMMKESLTVAAGGAAFGVLDSFLQKQLPVSLVDSGVKKLLVTAAEGFLAGRLLWGQNQDLAKGALGAAGALLGQQLVGMFMSNEEQIAPSPDVDKQDTSTAGYLYGLDDSTKIEVEDRVNGTTLADSIVIEEEPASMAGWLA